MRKQRWCGALLALALVLTLLPTAASAAENSLTEGGTYYFDLSGAGIPGSTDNSERRGAKLPDTTLHYVPFTYVGAITAYKYTSRTTKQNAYEHSLFIADYVVTYNVSWQELGQKELIFGKDNNYTSDGVNYTMRAPSVGDTYHDQNAAASPSDNEWDKMLDANEAYIKNCSGISSQGQDIQSGTMSTYVSRGRNSSRNMYVASHVSKGLDLGFRPVLEISNPADLKVVTLDLNGGTIGSVSGEIKIVVKNGSAFTAPSLEGVTAPTGYSASGTWKGSNGKTYAPGDSVPASVTTLTAEFTRNTYTVTLHANGGTIADGKNITKYTYGIGATLPTADDMTYTGYTFGGWYDNEDCSGSPITTIAGTETGDKEYWAKWTANTYSITYELNGGANHADNPSTYTYGTGVSELHAPTKSGYRFGGWYTTEDFSGDAVTEIAADSTENVTLYAKWTRVSSGSYTPSYSASVEKTEHGSVSVSPRTAAAGTTVTVTVTPDQGYTLETLTVTDASGKELPLTDKGDGRFTFTQPSSKVTVRAAFMDDNTMLNFFVDVKASDYYYDAVLWAAQKGITSGISATEFGPNQPCIRAQIVTFLWRAAGSPVVNYAMSMDDVNEGSYYAEAVRWALSLGVTTGTGADAFSPDASCTRAQAVTFLARARNAKASGKAAFRDVPSGSYYADAVAWAAESGVTTGTSADAFSPDDVCTRAQIITFLYRAFQ